MGNDIARIQNFRDKDCSVDSSDDDSRTELGRCWERIRNPFIGWLKLPASRLHEKEVHVPSQALQCDGKLTHIFPLLAHNDPKETLQPT